MLSLQKRKVNGWWNLLKKITVMKRWYRFRRQQIFIIIVMALCIILYTITRKMENSFDLTRRNAIIHYLELEERLKEDKGTGCEIPVLDPFAKEIAQYDINLPKVVCSGQDWVKCYLSECRVDKKILANTSHLKCIYSDILFETERVRSYGAPTTVYGDIPYVLTKSDHVVVKCTGIFGNCYFISKWAGVGAGYRTQVERKAVPPGRENSVDVLFFAFDSTSKNGFIRRMPKSYKLLKELGATVLDGYNIVGDGTPAALFPILTGKTELEMPDVRRVFTKTGTFNVSDFIFAKMKDYGYNTAFFEDRPDIGTFQYRFNGFNEQPADHYLRHFYLEENKLNGKKYCAGDTPTYDLMMNLTSQFFKLPGKHFCFTFIVDITHEDFNLISNADDSTVTFLTDLRNDGVLDNTLVFLFGDHGSRFARIRNSYQGKLEERMPLMAILLPKVLTDARPDIQAKLNSNTKTLTTPHDIYATYIDALDLNHLQNPYKIKGADLNRGLSLFETIPSSRSCSEAGVEPHWCTCLRWDNVSAREEVYTRAVDGFVDYINELTEPVRHKCAIRKLISVEYVQRQQAHKTLLQFKYAEDNDGYVANFGPEAKRLKENYQVKVTVGPGRGTYEASGTYIVNQNRFIYNVADISRVNAYNDEPSCISSTHPHLNMYCYCY